MIYIPELPNENNCVVWYDSNTLRVYDSIPTTNSSIKFTDYYVNSHYVSNESTELFGDTVILNCINKDNFTSEFWYRNDFADICIIFSCILFIFLIFVNFICKSFFRGLFK